MIPNEKKRYSKRALANFTRQVNLQIDFMKSTLQERRETLKKIKRFAKYKLPGYKQQVARELFGIKITIKKIAILTKRKLQLQKEGKIN